MTTDRIPALLEPIQNRLNAAVNDPENGRVQLTFAVRATKDQARLLAAIEAVLAMHGQDTYGPRFCSCGEHWPCPTVRTVEAALTRDA